MLNQPQFDALAAAGYNRIPLVRELLADLETPLSIYLKLANRPYSYLLESVQGGEKWGRYSIIGLPCERRLEITDHHIREIYKNNTVAEFDSADPLEDVRQFQQRYRVAESPRLPRFNGGLVGYFGYDTVKYIEPHLGANAVADPLAAADILLMVSHELVVFDNLAGRLFFVVHVDPSSENALENGKAHLDEIISELRSSKAHVYFGGFPSPPQNEDDKRVAEARRPADFNFSFPQSLYEQAVDRCKAYIHDGDAFQIALSHRISCPFTAPPLDLYRALRTLNPSPYMYYLNLDDYHIAGSSPEILVRLENGEITVRPIAGTRPRGANRCEDELLAKELLSDPKELAEHLMLIDLGRNDVGRVSQIGTVQVTDKMCIEKYSHVMHIVSNVTGKIKPKLDAIDVLKATFPAGTLSGAPKIRAMEILEELEPDKRGIYSGAIGYIGWNGNMDTAIAIRTALIHDNKVYVQAGAGIVADSVAASEWQETINKGRAIFRAIEMVQQGLHNPLDED